MPSNSDRPKRVCDVCGQFDNHPRHVIAYPPNEAPPVDREVLRRAISAQGLTDDERLAIVEDIQDTTLQLRHMDCCREAGCPDGSCHKIGAAGGEGLKGLKLADFLTSGKVDGLLSASSEEN